MKLSDEAQVNKLLSRTDDKYKNSVEVDMFDRQFSILYLPSQGHYYEDGTDSILIRFLSAKEEVVLTDEMLMESGHALHIVLNNLIISNFDIDNLLAGDFHAISMFLRSNAYGNNIELNVQCPQCGFEEKKKLRLDSFNMKKIKQLPDKGNLISCQLPLSRMKVVLKVPTFKDEIKVKQLNHDQSLEKLFFLIKSISGNEDSLYIREYLPKLPIRDIRYLKQFLEDSTPGVDTSFSHTCVNCNHEFKSLFEIGEGFLKLPPEYHEVVMNEVFLCHYYGKGITKENAEKMPTFHRSWTIRRIQEELDKKQQAEERAYKKSQSGSAGRRGRAHR